MIETIVLIIFALILIAGVCGIVLEIVAARHPADVVTRANFRRPCGDCRIPRAEDDVVVIALFDPSSEREAS